MSNKIHLPEENLLKRTDIQLLRRILGVKGVYSLMMLWDNAVIRETEFGFASDITNMADWHGDQKDFLNILTWLGFLRQAKHIPTGGEGYRIAHWHELNNGWNAKEKEA